MPIICPKMSLQVSYLLNLFELLLFSVVFLHLYQTTKLDVQWRYKFTVRLYAHRVWIPTFFPGRPSRFLRPSEPSIYVTVSLTPYRKYGLYLKSLMLNICYGDKVSSITSFSVHTKSFLCPVHCLDQLEAVVYWSTLIFWTKTDSSSRDPVLYEFWLSSLGSNHFSVVPGA